MFQFTPFTSELLENGNAIVNSLGEYAGIPDIPTLPSGKQVVFFTLGTIFIVASIAMMVRALADIPEVSSAIKLAAL